MYILWTIIKCHQACGSTYMGNQYTTKSCIFGNQYICSVDVISEKHAVSE